MAKASKHQKPPPRRTAEDRRYDEIELTEEDLEVVVGGMSLDAAQAAAAGRQQPHNTLLGEIAYNAGGQLQNAQIHFFQVGGKMFNESFARPIGAVAPAGQVAGVDMTPLLDLQFPAGQDPIVFAGLDWASVQFGNGIARFIIESGYGFPTYSLPGSSVPTLSSMRQTSAEVLVAATMACIGVKPWRTSSASSRAFFPCDPSSMMSEPTAILTPAFVAL